MAIIQSTLPRTVLSESPITLNIVDSGSVPTNSSYQFVSDLYLWKGDYTTDKPTTPTYTLSKFPIQTTSGAYIAKFDFSPLIDSAMSGSLMDTYSPELFEDVEQNIYWYSVEGYSKWYEGQTLITSSHRLANDGEATIALNGFNLWGERAGELAAAFNGLSGNYWSFSSSVDNYPILSIAPNVTQSLVRTDLPYYYSVYTHKDGITGLPLDPSGSNNPNQPQPIWAIAVGENGFVSSSLWDVPTVPNLSDSNQIVRNLRLNPNTMQALGNDIRILVTDASFNQIGSSVKLTFDCTKKYTPIRIIFKNRYGAFDQFDFSLVSRNTFNTSTRTFKTNALNSSNNLGNSYDVFKGSQTYFSEGSQTLTVNSDYVDESFNEFFKGLLVSDEIYWATGPNPYTDITFQNVGADVLPLTVTSTSTQLKTKEVDKLIQYSFTFEISTPYKLTL